VSEGIHEDVVVQNNSVDRVRVRVEIRFAADFADIFEVKDKTPKQGHVSSRVTGPDRVVMSYEHDGYRRGTEVIFSMPVKLTAHSAVFELDLGPRETWQTCCDISPEANGRLYSSELKDDDFGKGESDMSLTLAQWLEQAPGLETSWDTLHHTYVRSWVDLAALRGPLVLNVWASWCPPCRAELPALAEVARSAGDRVAFLGIDVVDDAAAATALMQQLKVPYPSVADEQGATRGPLRWVGPPVTYFVAADGRIAGEHRGQITSAAVLRGLIEKYLGVTV